MPTQRETINIFYFLWIFSLNTIFHHYVLHNNTRLSSIISHVSFILTFIPNCSNANDTPLEEKLVPNCAK